MELRTTLAVHNNDVHLIVIPSITYQTFALPSHLSDQPVKVTIIMREGQMPVKWMKKNSKE